MKRKLYSYPDGTWKPNAVKCSDEWIALWAPLVERFGWQPYGFGSGCVSFIVKERGYGALGNLVLTVSEIRQIVAELK